MKKILVVEDDASVRESVDHVLRDAGYDVVLAAGGAEAVAKSSTNPVDLVLMDIGLANQNGWQTCRHLAREHSDVPVIAMTGQAGQFKPALSSGAAALMEKPLDAQELLQTVHTLLGRSKEFDPMRSSETFYYIAHDPHASCDS